MKALEHARHILKDGVPDYKPGTANSDINVMAGLTVPAWVLASLISEIDRLHNPIVGPSFREIKQSLPQFKEETEVVAPVSQSSAS